MSEPDLRGIEIRDCPLPHALWARRHAWVVVDDQENAVAVFAVVQVSPDDPLLVKDCAVYTVPARRRQKLAKSLFFRARRDLADEDPPVAVQWSGVATLGGYKLAKSLGFRISDELSATLGASLDRRLAENPDNERLLAIAAFRAANGGRLPCDTLGQERADREGKYALRDAALVLKLRVAEVE
ncbi:hypothetical protein [Nocardia sp. NPDC060259]|uniref:hypothetical protein n=1 Tax=Nocardia sp. NPDC060259 TaxID=3347088 RepID=UPI00364809B9